MLSDEILKDLKGSLTAEQIDISVNKLMEDVRPNLREIIETPALMIRELLATIDELKERERELLEALISVRNIAEPAYTNKPGGNESPLIYELTTSLIAKDGR